MDEFGSDESQDNSNQSGGMGESRGGSYGGDRKMYKATFSDCGQECEVPFEPSAGRPVYCRNCFQNHRKPRHGGNRRY